MLAKLLPMVSPARRSGHELAGEGLEVVGADWRERLERMLEILPAGERSALLAIRVEDELALPLPCAKVIARARSEWFPELLSRGSFTAAFDPVVHLSSGAVVARSARIEARLDEARFGHDELLDAAEAHDAVYSFDRRARMVALESGLPRLGDGEMLLVSLDPRAVVDIEGSLSSTWPAVARAGGEGRSVCLNLAAGHTEDFGRLAALAAAHRDQGALIGLSDVSGGARTLEALEAIRPEIALLDPALTAGLDASRPRRTLVRAIVDCAHATGAEVVAGAIVRLAELEALRDLGADHGGGPLFGDTPLPALAPAAGAVPTAA